MFSIIIPTYNNIEYLKICITSILKNSNFNHEIIVHINEGNDGTEKYLIEKNIKYTFSKKNIGLCKAVNMASKKSTYTYIMYSHDDFYFCPDWDRPFAEEIKKIKNNKFYLSGTMFDYLGKKKFFCGSNYKDFNEDVFENYDNKKTLFHCDPPYFKMEDYYVKEFGRDEHLKLANLLKSIKGKFVLSYYDFPELSKWFPKSKFNWKQKEFNKSNSTKKSKASKGNEILILNY